MQDENILEKHLAKMDKFQIFMCVYVDGDFRSIYSLSKQNFNKENIEDFPLDRLKSLRSSAGCEFDESQISNANYAFIKKFDVNILTIKPFIEQLESSNGCRKSIYYSCKVVKNKKCLPSIDNNDDNTFVAIIKANLNDSYKIDYAWGLRLWRDCHIRLERECAAAWLSTLGGAFSALGDYSPKFASMAFHTSIQQIRLARIIDDENGIARGWLFLALALSQLGYGRFPRILLRRAWEYKSYDPRHKKMCLGVQAKLMYDAKLRRQARQSGIEESSHITEQKRQIWESFKSLAL